MGIGAVAFVACAYSHTAPVAQGFILAAFLFFFAIFKAKNIMFFGFALLGSLVAFSGVYTVGFKWLTLTRLKLNMLCAVTDRSAVWL